MGLNLMFDLRGTKNCLVKILLFLGQIQPFLGECKTYYQEVNKIDQVNDKRTFAIN